MRNPADVSTVMLRSSSGRKDHRIMVKVSAGSSSTFKLVPENCLSYMLQPAEKAPTILQSTATIDDAEWIHDVVCMVLEPIQSLWQHQHQSNHWFHEVLIKPPNTVVACGNLVLVQFETSGHIKRMHQSGDKNRQSLTPHNKVFEHTLSATDWNQYKFPTSIGNRIRLLLFLL